MLVIRSLIACSILFKIFSGHPLFKAMQNVVADAYMGVGGNSRKRGSTSPRIGEGTRLWIVEGRAKQDARAEDA
jgi:hypothetical protein